MLLPWTISVEPAHIQQAIISSVDRPPKICVIRSLELKTSLNQVRKAFTAASDAYDVVSSLLDAAETAQLPLKSGQLGMQLRVGCGICVTSEERLQSQADGLESRL